MKPTAMSKHKKRNLKGGKGRKPASCQRLAASHAAEGAASPPRKQVCHTFNGQPDHEDRAIRQPDAPHPHAEAEVIPYDDALLEACRTQWQFGDWESLASLNLERIQHHPERARLALLAAAGRFQHGDRNDAHHYLRLAMDWGASPRLAQQMLISGAHQSLGRAFDLLDAPERARQHLLEAVRTGGIPGDARLLVRARMAWQTHPPMHDDA